MAISIVVVAACGGNDSGPSGPFFERSMFFNRDVGDAAVHPSSQQWISSIRANGGWGYGDRLLVDFSFDVLHADASTPMREFTPMPGYFYTPDCDHQPVPVPAIGNIEGERDYACVGGGDCHLIVFDDGAGMLYEMYKADITSTFNGGCLAVWNTRASYDDTLRGDECSSADAAGLPIAPLLFTADEVAAGEIAHAIRFVLPNDRISLGFVRPATHGTDTNGSSGAPPYGIHLRLDPGYPVETLPSEGARVIARALQRYGMIHADGGEIALTAATDRYTTARWAGLLEHDDLQGLRLEDFDVIDHGEPIAYPYTCQR
jgi:serine/threonine-protein kinase